ARCRVGEGSAPPRAGETDSLERDLMSRSYGPYIAALALLWGASYMFIKVADRGFEPATMIMFRVVIASLLRTAALGAQRGLGRATADLRGLGWQGFGVGVANGAIPFTLI